MYNKGKNKIRKGISLIVLVITIIVIIILATAVIVTLMQNSPIKNAKEAVNANDIKVAQESFIMWMSKRWIEAPGEAGALYSGEITKEKSTVTVTKENDKTARENIELASLDENITVASDDIKNEITLTLSDLGLDNLDKIVVNQNVVISVTKGDFTIDKEQSEEKDVISNSKIFDINAKNIKNSEKIVKINGKNNINTVINGITLNENKTALKFNGDSSKNYGVIENLKITYPCTLSFAIKPEKREKVYSFIYSDEVNKIIFMINDENNTLYCSASNSNLYKVPDDFYDGNIKYITITYGTSSTDHQLYINSIPLEKENIKDYWTVSSGKILLGIRDYKGSYGDVYKGEIYDLKIYNKKLSLDEINELYLNDKSAIEENLKYEPQFSENLLVDYYIKDNSNIVFEKIIPDNSENKNDAIFSNISYSELSKAIYFDGSQNSYGIVKDKNIDIKFPCTLNFIIKPEQLGTYNVTFIDGKTNILFASLNNVKWLGCSSVTANVYSLPDDYFDGNIKYITIVYGKNSTDHQLYINGIAQEKLSSTDHWGNNSNDTYFGKRDYSSGDPYKGYLYKFTIYDGALSSEDVLKLYTSDFKKYGEK